jgi:peptidoglycan/LPS O-acetylase OafA/YrhL
VNCLRGRHAALGEPSSAESEVDVPKFPIQPAVEDAVAPPPGNPRFESADAVRALAAIGVLVFHVGQVTAANEDRWWGALTARLNAGVPMFFVLSGLLLYRPFVAGRFGVGRSPTIRAYFRRRVLRIVPAYWLALTALAIYPGLVGVFTHRWWTYYFFGQTYSRSTIIAGIPPAWSLSTEVAFYVFLPVFALVVAAAARRFARAEWAALATIATVAIGVRTAVQATGVVPVLPYTLLGTLDWFALGMALAVLSTRAAAGAEPWLLRIAGRSPFLPWTVAISVFLVVSLALGLPRAEHQSGVPNHYSNIAWLEEHILYGIVAFLVVLPVVARTTKQGLPQRFLALRPLKWLGLISYGIFLWHVPLLVLLAQHPAWFSWSPIGRFETRLLSVFAVTVFCAATSYYVVERPLLRLKYRRDQRPGSVEFRGKRGGTLSSTRRGRSAVEGQDPV